jgi:diguanylate cyclase (GGDEF)-like protein
VPDAVCMHPTQDGASAEQADRPEQPAEADRGDRAEHRDSRGEANRGDRAERSSRLAGSRRRWMLAAVAILIAGVAASLAGALSWRSSVRAHDKQSFQVASTDVAETLETLLSRDADFVASLRAVLTMQPHLSATGFHQWFKQLQGKQRQVGGLGTTVVEAVPMFALRSFQAKRDADPAFRALVDGAVVPVVRGSRSSYCLLSAGATMTPYSREVGELLEGNWCDPHSAIGSFPVGGSSAPVLVRTESESGQFLVYPVSDEGVTTVFVEGAFYRRGMPLVSAAQRRTAVAGWVGSSFQINALIGAAVGEHRGLSVALYHSNPGEPERLVGRVGVKASQGALSHSSTMNIDGTWQAVVGGSAAAAGLSPNAQGLALLLAGAIVSLLVSALVVVLARSRERALGMVDEKTGELRHQALHDGLTGLPNRVLALDRAAQMLARARRRRVPVAALFIDIDGFKHVNDTFGHAAGDELLRTVAMRLASVVRDGDTAARLGGDEFVVLLEGGALDASPELVAERVREVLRQPYDISDHVDGHAGRQLSITASIGIAAGERMSADELLRDADVALYEAKAAGKDRHVTFESSMQTAAQDQLALELDLAEAVARDELFLLYQPTFELDSERVVGVEALIRWCHPTRGIVSPDDFIPIAESSGLIIPIGRWVLAQACRQAATWHRRGRTIGIAVNVSARQLDADELIDDVRAALDASGLDPATLTLEVTETTLMSDTDAASKRLHLLKQLGVLIAIDDFGTGYSSLAYLRQFPADVLKIDRSFVSAMDSTNESTALIHTLVQLGKSLHIQTLAEGIEDREQLHTLQREHCDHGQGFLFSRPLDVEALEQFLDAAAAPVATV